MAGGVSGLPGKPHRGDKTEKTVGQRDSLRIHIPEGFAAAAWRKMGRMAQKCVFFGRKQKFQEEMRCRQERVGTPGTAATS